MKIGLIGYGHLGAALLTQLVKVGFGKDNLRITISGSSRSLAKIESDGVSDIVLSNQELAMWADIVIITLRPTEALALQDLFLEYPGIVISAMAGLKTTSLEILLAHDVYRVMPSSPITIENGNPICGIFPWNKNVADLFGTMGFKSYILNIEEQLHVFTSLVCLPAAFLLLSLKNRAYEIPKNNYGFQEFFSVFNWALENTPTNLSMEESEQYISRMATKGGITETIVRALRTGNNLPESINLGIKRSKEISESLSQ